MEEHRFVEERAGSVHEARGELTAGGSGLLTYVPGRSTNKAILAFLLFILNPHSSGTTPVFYYPHKTRLSLF